MALFGRAKPLEMRPDDVIDTPVEDPVEDALEEPVEEPAEEPVEEPTETDDDREERLVSKVVDRISAIIKPVEAPVKETKSQKADLSEDEELAQLEQQLVEHSEALQVGDAIKVAMRIQDIKTSKRYEKLEGETGAVRTQQLDVMARTALAETKEELDTYEAKELDKWLEENKINPAMLADPGARETAVAVAIRRASKLNGKANRKDIPESESVIKTGSADIDPSLQREFDKMQKAYTKLGIKFDQTRLMKRINA
jgi:hypothetical protein